MTIDTKELRRLAQAVSGWSNCNQAWLDQSEDVPAAAVGHIDEDGNTYPIATIDCDQYYAAHQSLPLAKFYAAANPAAISELLDCLEEAEKERDNANAAAACVALQAIELEAKLEAAEKERDECNSRRLEAADHFAAQTALMKEKCDALLAKVEQMERQEPVATIRLNSITGNPSVDFIPGHRYLHHNSSLYALPGVEPATNVPDGWKEAAIAWEVCASIHRAYGKGKDPFFNTRQGDFVKHANDARAMSALATEAKP